MAVLSGLDCLGLFSSSKLSLNIWIIYKRISVICFADQYYV